MCDEPTMVRRVLPPHFGIDGSVWRMRTAASFNVLNCHRQLFFAGNWLLNEPIEWSVSSTGDES